MSEAARAAGGLRFAAKVGPSRRLFCLPYAGGGAGVFRAWSPILAPDIELVAVQLPGREGRLREPSFASIEEIVAAVLPLVVRASDLPYALFGHSMGALIAYALTVALEREGQRAPAHLFLSARRPPDEPDPESPLHGLPEAQFLDVIQTRYGAIPEAVLQEPDLLALLLPTLRADIGAIERFPLSSQRVRCPVHVFGGARDRHPAPAQLAGWQRVAEQPVRVRLFEGDHFYLAAQREALVADICSQWPRPSS